MEALQYKLDMAERWSSMAWQVLTGPETAVMGSLHQAEFYKERAISAAKKAQRPDWTYA